MRRRARASGHARALPADELAVGDPEDPLAHLAALGVEPVAPVEGRRPRLRAQVRGDLRVPAAPAQVAEHGADVAAIERGELGGPAAQELLVVHAPTYDERPRL